MICNYIFVRYIVSEIFLGNRHLFTLIICGKGAPLFLKKKISHSVYPSPDIGYIRFAVDNKRVNFTRKNPHGT